MAGNSFMVTVRAPNAPCRQTQTRVAVGHHGLSAGVRPRWRHAPTVSTMMSTPTPVAR